MTEPDSIETTRRGAQPFDGLSATQLAAGLRDGRWSSVELTRHFLARITERNPRVHAAVSVEADEALAQAAQSDRRRADGAALGALDGMPMTVKDAFRMQGYVSTYGYWMFRNYRPKADCRVIAALRASGAVFMGRTAVPTGSFDWNCRNQVHPECVNPYDSARTPGGSSGGAAAALAAGMTPLEIGSDFHGSLRYPAHCCGVYSLRTTDGWLPIEDWGPEGFPAAFRRIATCGPMATTLADLHLLIEPLERAFPIPAPGAPSGASPRLRVACSRELLGLRPDRATGQLLDRLLARLEGQGHEICEAAPELDWQSLERDFGMIGGHEFTALLPRLLRNGLVKRLYAHLALQSRLGAGPFLTHFRRGMLAGQAGYEAALQRREQMFSAVAEFFSRHDLWLLPVSPSAAIPRRLCGKKIPSEHGEIEYLRYLGSYLGATAMLGTPVLTAPLGHDQDGLPVGIQMHGARFSDRRLVQAAGALSI